MSSIILDDAVEKVSLLYHDTSRTDTYEYREQRAQEAVTYAIVAHGCSARHIAEDAGVRTDRVISLITDAKFHNIALAAERARIRAYLATLENTPDMEEDEE